MDPAARPRPIAQPGVRITYAMPLQDDLVRLGKESVCIRRREPGRQRGNRQRNRGVKPRAQAGDEPRVDLEAGDAGIVIDFNPGNPKTRTTPISDQAVDIRLYPLVVPIGARAVYPDNENDRPPAPPQRA